MPFGSAIITTDATLNRGDGILLAEKGFLVGVDATPETAGLGNAEAFGQILLVSTDTPAPVEVVNLVSGYIGASVHISWTGRIKLEPTFAVQCFVFCDLSFNFRLTVLTEVV